MRDLARRPRGVLGTRPAGRRRPGRSAQRRGYADRARGYARRDRRRVELVLPLRGAAWRCGRLLRALRHPRAGPAVREAAGAARGARERHLRGARRSLGRLHRIRARREAVHGDRRHHRRPRASHAAATPAARCARRVRSHVSVTPTTASASPHPRRHRHRSMPCRRRASSPSRRQRVRANARRRRVLLGRAAKLSRKTGVRAVRVFGGKPCVITIAGALDCGRWRASAGVGLVDAFDHCVLHGDGSVDCTGDNEYGQLGDGHPTLVTTPVQVPGLDDSPTCACRHTESCASATDTRCGAGPPAARRTSATTR